MKQPVIDLGRRGLISGLGAALISTQFPMIAYAGNRLSAKARARLLGGLRWSNVATWGGSLPISTTAITIPAGQKIIMDAAAMDGAQIDISGTLIADPTVATMLLKCAGIHILAGGTLEIGASQGNRHTNDFTLAFDYGVYVAVGTDGLHNTNPGVSRGLIVDDGGNLIIHGDPPNICWTKLNGGTAGIGATSFTAKDTLDWKNGDNTAIGPTTYYDATGTELRVINGAASTTSFAITAGLTKAKYTKIQYATDTGVSETPGTFVTVKAHANVPTQWDQRAPVLNLTRNIKILGCTSAADSDWVTFGHGGHIMKMGNTGKMQLYGIEFRRMGQLGVVARYPIHWHMCSWNQGTGAFLGDVADNYAHKNSIWESKNRAITIHGTCGVPTAENVAYDIIGHAYFFEDGSERRSPMTRNAVLKTRAPVAGAGPIVTTFTIGTPGKVNRTNHGLVANTKVVFFGGTLPLFDATHRITTSTIYYVRNPGANDFELATTSGGASLAFVDAGSGTTSIGSNQIKLHDAQPAGFWITNPDNVISYCHAGDCSHGFWRGFAPICFGASGLVTIKPVNIASAGFHHNLAHSCDRQGMRTANPANNEIGDFTAGLNANAGNSSNGDPLYLYRPTSNEGPAGTRLQDNITDLQIHHCGRNESFIGPYFNHQSNPLYERWALSDNVGQELSGIATTGIAQHMLGAAFTNNIGAIAQPAPLIPRQFTTSYHSTLNVQDSSFFNYIATPKVMWTPTGDVWTVKGGILGEGDYYLPRGGIEKGASRNTGWKWYNSHPGGMSISPEYDGFGECQPGLSPPLWSTATFANGGTSVTWASHGKSVGNKIAFDVNGGTLPPEVVSGRVYRVQSIVDTNTITIEPRETSGVITFSAAGTGSPKVFASTGLRHFSIAHVHWDAQGYKGAAGNYVLYNVPFLTYGLSSSTAVTGDSDAVSTPDVFCGLSSFYSDSEVARGGDTSNFYSPLDVQRYSDGTLSTVVGEHHVSDGLDAYSFGIFRHFAVRAGTNTPYKLTMPNMVDPTAYHCVTLANAYRSTDTFVFSIPWGGAAPKVWTRAGYFASQTTCVPTGTDVADGFVRQASISGANVQAVISDTTGATFYWDAAAKLVWVRHVGGLIWDTASVPYNVNADVAGDKELYKVYMLGVTPA